MKSLTDFKMLRRLVADKPSNLSDECQAAKVSLQRFDDCTANLSAIDVDAIMQEWKGLIADRGIPSLTDQELEKAARLQGILEWYDQCSRDRENLGFTLTAMTVFIQDKTRDEILYELSSENWLNKHEVLTRWAWMKSQKALADKRRIRFNYLYECEVGERDGRQNLDREFYDFLHFLPEYSAQVGKEFLFLEKSESPDFVVVDDMGNKLGIEITEAPLNAGCFFRLKTEHFSA